MKRIKKWISVLLAFTMLVPSMGATAFAEESNTASQKILFGAPVGGELEPGIYDAPITFTYIKAASNEKQSSIYAGNAIDSDALLEVTSEDGGELKYTLKMLYRAFKVDAQQTKTTWVHALKSVEDAVPQEGFMTFTEGQNLMEGSTYAYQYSAPGATSAIEYRWADLPMEDDSFSNLYIATSNGLGREEIIRHFQIELQEGAQLRPHQEVTELEPLIVEETGEFTEHINKQGKVMIQQQGGSSLRYRITARTFGPEQSSVSKKADLHCRVRQGENGFGDWMYLSSGDVYLGFAYHENNEQTEAAIRGSQTILLPRAWAGKEISIEVKQRTKIGEENGQDIVLEGETAVLPSFTPTKESIQYLEDDRENQFWSDAYVIPYDAQMKIAKISDTSKLALIKEAIGTHLGTNSMDFAAFDIDLVDPDTNETALSVNGTWDYMDEADTFAYSYWGVAGEKEESYETFAPEIRMGRKTIDEDWNLSAVKLYKIKTDGTMIPIKNNSFAAQVLGTVNFKIDPGTPKGTYIVMKTPYQPMKRISDLYNGYYITPVKNGNYTITTEAEEPDTTGKLSAFNAYLNKTAYMTLSGVDESKMILPFPGGIEQVQNVVIPAMLDEAYTNLAVKAYIGFQPEAGIYVASVKIKGEEIGSDKWLEAYTVDGKTYPKRIEIDTDGGKSYVEAEIALSDNTTRTVHIALNYANYVPAQPMTAAEPVITTQTGKFKFRNEETATVSMTTAAYQGKVWYQMNGGEVQEYTGEVTLETSKPEGETFVITAYTEKAGMTNSASVTKTIVFREEGAFSEDVAVPVIKPRYASGNSASDGIYKVNITSSTESAEVYYTLDGSVPSKSSSKYEEPFEVPVLTNGEPTHIRAIGYKDGFNDSEIGENRLDRFSTKWFDNFLEGDSIIVGVEMLKHLSNPPSYSMGNGALTGEMRLYKKDGQVYGDVYFRSINMGAITGHLIDFWYFKEEYQEMAEVLNGFKNALEAKGLENSNDNILSEFGTKAKYAYDAFNQIDYITIPISNDKLTTITGLESDYKGMGKQICTLRFNFDSAIEFVTGKKVIREKTVDTPIVNAVLSADGKSYEISLTMPSASESRDASLYYMVSGPETSTSTIFTEGSRYTAPFTITKAQADAMGGIEGSFNVYAAGRKEGFKDSVINGRKLTFTTQKPGGNTDPGNEGDVDVTQDGKYWVGIKLYKSGTDEPSMGQVAFENNPRALITTKGGQSVIQIATNPVRIPPYYSALHDMQFHNGSSYQYVTRTEEKELTTTYNKKEETFDYLARFEFLLPSTSAEYVPVKVNVPYTPMDNVTQNVGGFIDARIKIDWDTLEKADPNAQLRQNAAAAQGNITVEGEAMDVTDAKTGIRLIAEGNVLPNGTQLVVESYAEKDDAYKKAQKTLDAETYESFHLVGIFTKLDKMDTLPAGNVKLMIPLDVSLPLDKLQIFRITEDTEGAIDKTLMKYTLSEDGKYYVLETAQLGVFALALSKEVVEEVPLLPEELLDQEAQTDMVAGFEDVSGHWAAESIRLVKEMQLFSGVSETTFAPDLTMNRGMFVTVMGRLAKVSPDAYGQSSFVDVNQSDYYAGYVTWATLKEITSGVSDESFGAKAEITREQMAVMLLKTAEALDITLAKGNAKADFADQGEISPWAQEAVNSLVQAGILNGRPDGSFDPQGTATRAEVATILAQFVRGYQPERIAELEAQKEVDAVEPTEETESELAEAETAL